VHGLPAFQGPPQYGALGERDMSDDAGQWATPGRGLGTDTTSARPGPSLGPRLLGRESGLENL